MHGCPELAPSPHVLLCSVVGAPPPYLPICSQQASQAGVGAAMAYKAMVMAVCDPPTADRDAAVQRNLLKATNSQAPVALYIMVSGGTDGGGAR
jgi:hypothetical protein